MQSCRRDMKETRRKSLRARYGECDSEGVRHAAYLQTQLHEHNTTKDELQRARRAEQGSLALADDSRNQMKSLRSQLNGEWRTVVERLSTLCHQFGATNFSPSGQWTDAADCLELTLLQQRDAVSAAEQSAAEHENSATELSEQLQQLLADDTVARGVYDQMHHMLVRIAPDSATLAASSSPLDKVQWLEQRISSLQQEIRDCHQTRSDTDELIGELTTQFRSTAEQVNELLPLKDQLCRAKESQSLAEKAVEDMAQLLSECNRTGLLVSAAEPAVALQPRLASQLAVEELPSDVGSALLPRIELQAQLRACEAHQCAQDQVITQLTTELSGLLLQVQDFEALKAAHSAQTDSLVPLHEAFSCAEIAQEDLSKMLQVRERDCQLLEQELSRVRDEARMTEGAATAAQHDADTMAAVNSQLGVAVQSAEDELDMAQAQLQRSLSGQDEALHSCKEAKELQDLYRFDTMKAKKEVLSVKQATHAVLAKAKEMIVRVQIKADNRVQTATDAATQASTRSTFCSARAVAKAFAKAQASKQHHLPLVRWYAAARTTTARVQEQAHRAVHAQVLQELTEANRKLEKERILMAVQSDEISTRVGLLLQAMGKAAQPSEEWQQLCTRAQIEIGNLVASTTTTTTSLTAVKESSKNELRLEQARILQLAKLADPEWLGADGSSATDAQVVVERALSNLRAQLTAVNNRTLGELSARELEDALAYVSRSVRRLTSPSADPPAPIPAVMQAPLLGDLKLSLEALEHHVTANHLMRAETLALQKAHELLTKYADRCTTALESLARKETQGVAEDLAQLMAAGAESASASTAEAEVQKVATKTGVRMVAAVQQASCGKLAAGASTSIAATTEPMLFECVESHTAVNGSQLSVEAGRTVLVQQVHDGMLEAQLLNEGERVGPVGWIPVRCVSISPTQLAQLECSQLLGTHESQTSEVVLLRTRIWQLQRALADVENRHASDLMAARSRNKRAADDRVSEERIRCAEVIDELSAKLDYAKADTDVLTAESKSSIDLLKAEIKAIKEKHVEDLQMQKNESLASVEALKTSALAAQRAKVDAKEFELTEMYEEKLESQEVEWEEKVAAMEEDWEERAALLNR